MDHHLLEYFIRSYFIRKCSSKEKAASVTGTLERANHYRGNYAYKMALCIITNCRDKKKFIIDYFILLSNSLKISCAALVYIFHPNLSHQ